MTKESGLLRAGMRGHLVAEDGSCDKCSSSYPKVHDCGGFEHFEGSNNASQLIDEKLFWGFRAGCDSCAVFMTHGLHTVGDPKCARCKENGGTLVPHECGGLVHYLSLGTIGNNSKCDKCDYDGTYRDPDGEWF